MRNQVFQISASLKSSLRSKVAINRALIVFLSLGFLVAYWFFVEFVLASRKGFEFTDEALYLLAAREVAGTAQWGFPWGWHTAPFYHLVGGDVANFRTLGGYLLTLAGGMLGVSAYVGAVSSVSLAQISAKSHRLQMLLFGVVGVAATFLYYASLLRAPSYNWVNLMGLLVAFAGGFLSLRETEQKSSRAKLLPLAIVAFGLVFAAPGKPTTSILSLVVLFFAWTLVLGLRRGLLFSGVAAVFGGVHIGLLVLVGVWPFNFFASFFHPLGSPSLAPSLRQMVGDIVVLPQTFFDSLSDLHPIPYLLFLGSLFLWGASYLTSKFFLSLRVASVFAVLTSAFVIIVSSVGVGWASPDRTTAWLVLGVIGFGSLFSFGSGQGGKSQSRADLTRVLGVALASTSIPILFGFGSGNGVYGQASHASVGFALAAMVLFLSSNHVQLRYFIFSSVAVFALAASTLVLVSSHESPYRMASMSHQVFEVRLADDNGSSLFVDVATKQRIESFVSLANEVGLAPGTPLIGLVWGWNAETPYLVAAQVPESLMVTLFGHGRSVELATYNITVRGAGFDWQNTWIIVDDWDEIRSDAGFEVREVLDELELISGRKFPEDYVRVGFYGDAGIFKPLNGYSSD